MENKNEQVKQKTIKLEETSRLEVIGAVITVGVLGFWFGIGATLGAKMVNNLEEQIIKWQKNHNKLQKNHNKLHK